MGTFSLFVSENQPDGFRWLWLDRKFVCGGGATCPHLEEMLQGRGLWVWAGPNKSVCLSAVRPVSMLTVTRQF